MGRRSRRARGGAGRRAGGSCGRRRGPSRRSLRAGRRRSSPLYARHRRRREPGPSGWTYEPRMAALRSPGFLRIEAARDGRPPDYHWRHRSASGGLRDLGAVGDRTSPVKRNRSRWRGCVLDGRLAPSHGQERPEESRSESLGDGGAGVCRSLPAHRRPDGRRYSDEADSGGAATTLPLLRRGPTR